MKVQQISRYQAFFLAHVDESSGHNFPVNKKNRFVKFVWKLLRFLKADCFLF